MFVQEQNKTSKNLLEPTNTSSKSGGNYLKDNRPAREPLVQKKEKIVINSAAFSGNEAPIQMEKGSLWSTIGSGLYSGASYMASAAATGLAKGSNLVLKTAKKHPYLTGAAALALTVASPAIAGTVALGTAAGFGINAYTHYKNGNILKGPKEGQKGLENLPEKEMWRMYINPKDHKKALRASREDVRMHDKPGDYYRYYDEHDKSKDGENHFGNSMLDAIHSELFFKGGKLGKKVDYKEYTRLHDLVTGKFTEGKVGESGTAKNMRTPSSNAEMTAFPMNDWDNNIPKPAHDLMTEKINGKPMVHEWKEGENMKTHINEKVTYNTPDGYLRVLYDEKTGQQIAQQILDRYYGEIKGAKDKKTKINVIVKAIRALHVAHPFKDANGRLHVQLMLNKFLLEQGLSPTILGHKGLGIFGGAVSIEEITEDVTLGMETFNSHATA